MTIVLFLLHIMNIAIEWLLVLDEFSQHLTLGSTCTKKGRLGSPVLMSLVIGTFVLLSAKCPNM